MAKHSELTGEDIHSPHSYIFDDETARLAATGFNVKDIYKVAIQLSDTTVWMITAVNPTVTWKCIS